MSLCKRTHGSSIIKTVQLMLLTVKISACPDTHNKHKYSQRTQLTVFLILFLNLVGLPKATELQEASFIAFFT